MKPIFVQVARLDFWLNDYRCCQWCGQQKPTDQLRFSLRVDPVPRVILFCLSCRAREAAGQLDAYGHPVSHA